MKPPQKAACGACQGAALGFDFSMAFQPIVNLTSGEVFAHEALVRGPRGEAAGWVFAQVNDDNRYRFDQSCRGKAVSMAARLGLPALLSINFMPNAVYKPELCIRTTLEAASRFGLPPERIIFEITEAERVADHVHLREIVAYYQATGFKTAIDDFGAGYAGLNLLADIQTDIVKLDMALIRGVDRDRGRQAIVRGVLQVCRELAITPVAEGIETREELLALSAMGVELVQGNLLAPAAFESLAAVRL